MKTANLCVALLVGPAAYLDQYASDLLVARLDLRRFVRPLIKAPGRRSRAAPFHLAVRRG